MKRIRYGVAMSLDGYIAGPKGEADWIPLDPDVNFAEIWAQFDTLLIGRRTYEVATSRLGKKAFQGMKTFVVSTTLRPASCEGVSVLPTITRELAKKLRDQSSKDIWLMGGGQMFRTMLEMQEVDALDVNLTPILLGGGVALLPPLARQAKLKLTAHNIYSSGRISLSYDVVH